MLFKNDYIINCDQIDMEVKLTTKVDASAGMGCMVNYDHIDYSCDKQNECQFFRKERCPLITTFDLSEWDTVQ